MADPRYDLAALLARTAELSARYIAALPDRHVGAREDASTLTERLRIALPDGPDDPVAVIERMAEELDPGLVATAGPRYFGFIVGGALPASIAADWLTAAWDQNGSLSVLSPAAAAAEDIAAAWMKDLLGIPSATSHGLTTGAGLANAVGVATGRHAVLAARGWDVEARGLYGAPEITVIVSDEAHATLLTALQYLGLGRERVTRIPTDDRGAMLGAPLAEAVRATCDTPVIVCAQAGTVNTGAIDPLSATWMALSVCGHRLFLDCVTSSPAWTAPTRGRPMLTNGSTSATTRDSWRRATRAPIAPRWRPPRLTSWSAESIANRRNGCSTRRAALVGSPSMRCFVRSGERGSPISSTAAAYSRAA